jgi:hypothetical protein
MVRTVRQMSGLGTLSEWFELSGRCLVRANCLCGASYLTQVETAVMVAAMVAMLVTAMVMVAGVTTMGVVAMVAMIITMVLVMMVVAMVPMVMVIKHPARPRHPPPSSNHTDSQPKPDICQIARAMQTAGSNQTSPR